MPGLDKVDRKGRLAIAAERSSVKSNTGTRILRSQADHNSTLHSITRHRLIASAMYGFQLRMPT